MLDLSPALFCRCSFLIYEMRVIVPGYTVIVKHFARHLVVGSTCADLLLLEREDQDYSVVFPSSFSIVSCILET